MKKSNFIRGFVCSLLLVAANGTSHAQSFSIGHRSLTATDPARNRTVTMEVYYPSDVAGDQVPFTQQPIMAPILVFGHGFVMTWDAYSNLWQTLVPRGYLMAFVTTEGSFSPNHLEFGKDISFTVSHMQSLSASSADLFYQRLDSAAAVMGHSMGGGSAFLAVGFNTSIRAIATLAAAETSTSAIAAATGITIPSLVIAGANDCVTPPPQHQIPMYNALASACKTYVSITGASHCQMAQTNFFCNFGESTCTPPPSISRQDQHLAVDRFLVPWLDFQLRNDCIAGLDFDTRVGNDPGITYQRTCQLCPPTGESAAELENSLQIFNAGSTNGIRLQWSSEDVRLVAVHDLSGRLVSETTTSPGQHFLQIPTSGWDAGIYQVTLHSSSGTFASRRILIEGR